ncbi:MAG TPA: glycosyltransferase family 4 protein [Chryseosolibacter sp.]
MKVLILHQHFNTPYEGGAIRSYYLAKALVDSGIETVVITGSNDKSGIEDVDGIEVHYLKISYNNSFGFLDRSFSFLRFMNGAIRESRKIDNIGLVYAISVPLTVGGAAMRIKKQRNIPFIFEVGDLWPEAPIEMGFIKNPLLKTYLRNLEKRIYMRAESVVALSPSIEAGVLKVHPQANVHQIPNMADTDFYRPEEKDPVLEKKFRVEGKFVISYIGALGFANGLHDFLDAAQAADNAKLPVHFILCGAGATETALVRRISNGLTNVSFKGFQNREGVRELMNVTDAAFISYLPFPILQTGSPNKYFDALAAGKMIITNFGGWIRQEINENFLGFSFDNNPGEFVSKLSEFLNSRARIKLAQQRARQLAEEKYSRKILAEKFCGIIRETVGRKN